MDTDKCRSVDLDFKPYVLKDDNRFSEDPIDFDGDYLLGNMSGEKKLHGSSLVDIDNQVPESTLSKELECTQRTGRYNLRKSLAWDSAFFTSAGVLDQQELSSIITGENKSEQFLLPGIEEDISGSTESIPTLESGNLNLESVDEDLFLDIRASIQRSSKKQSNFATTISKPRNPVDIDSSAVSSLKKEDSVSAKRNPKPVVEKTSGLQAIRMPKGHSKPYMGKAGPAKAVIKQDSSSSSQIAETSSSLIKRPKAMNGPIPALPPTAKKDSARSAHAKSETSVSSKEDRSPKPSVPYGARRMVSSKISSVSSTTSRLSSVRSSTSSNSSSSISSVTSTKSSLIMPTRNPAKTDHVRSGLSSPKPTPFTASQKNKPPHSTLSTLSSKMSSNVSPTSSMGEWSSASSSSVMFSPRSSNLRNSIETGSCRSVDNGITVLDLQSNSADETDEHERTQGVALQGKNVDISSVQKCEIQAPAKQPSGLRRPSPKIGYFDGVKSAGAKGPPLSHPSLSSVRSKAGSSALCSPARNSNGKVKSNKIPLPRARLGTSPAKTKLDSPKGKAFSLPFPEKSDDVGNCSCDVMDLKDTSGLPLEVATIPVPKNLGESEIVRAEGGTEEAVDVHGTTIIKKNICNKISETKLNMPKNPSNGDAENAIEGCDLSSLESINWSENALVNVNNHQNVSTYPICEVDDKESDILQHQTERLKMQDRDLDPVFNDSKIQSLNDESSVKDFFCNLTTASESRSSQSPCPVKNVVCDDGCTDLSNEMVTQSTNNAAFVVPPEQKENS